MNRRHFLELTSIAGLSVTTSGLRWTWAAADELSPSPQTVFSSSIIVAGRAYELGRDIRVVNFVDNPTYGFVDMDEPRRGEDELGVLSDEERLERLRSAIHRIVLSRDGAPTSHHGLQDLRDLDLSTHFLVNHDGGIIQALDPLFTARCFGELDLTSIGIHLNNLARIDVSQPVFSDPIFGGTVDYATRGVVDGCVNGRMWSSFEYSEAQYVTLRALLGTLCDVLGVPRIVPLDADAIGLESRLLNPDFFYGVCGHSHVSACVSAPGPGLSWPRLVEDLHDIRLSWPLDLGLPSPSELRSEEEVEAAMAVYFAVVDESGAAATYPFGPDSRWHDGIGLSCDLGTPVRAIADGEIVLTRNGPCLPTGSPNFVLLRHELSREVVVVDEKRETSVRTEVTPWYSLYLHLERMDSERVAGLEQPDWYRRMLALAGDGAEESLTPGADLTLDDALAEPHAFYELVRDRLRPADPQNARASLEQGRPFRWVDPTRPESSGPTVTAGALLGYTGESGQYADGRVRRDPQVGLQVFAPQPIFDDSRFGHSTWLRRRALSDELSAAPTSTRDDQARRERRTIGVHTSQWDLSQTEARWAATPMLDLTETPAEQLLRYSLELGFQWLTDETWGLAGLTAPGQPIYTYHPIYLIGFLMLHYGAAQNQAFEEVRLDRLADEIDCQGWERDLQMVPVSYESLRECTEPPILADDE